MESKWSEDMERCRGKLNLIIEKEGMDAPTLLEVSRELDERISRYVQHKQKISSKGMLNCSASV